MPETETVEGCPACTTHGRWTCHSYDDTCEWKAWTDHPAIQEDKTRALAVMGGGEGGERDGA